MYLKSLQVIGFKSFADRTTVNFDRGVTAVVGPNGCGKSNVLDAIRWVLGEQSAKALRGGEMKDVIFSGTESRKSMGMAEVSLTFSDCEKDLGLEYHEVTVTRRIFRDGAGEYELNNTPCRLKDIQQLFMDTGIGRTAYSIMEQGKIDQILSSRPEDRRAVFEEAAGITKFKSQKREALRKLEHTEANLVRLADIIREVKRQIGSLQRQAGKARRYREAFDVLKEMEGKLARHQFDAYSNAIGELEEQVQSRSEVHNQMLSSSEKLEAQLSQKRQSLQQIEEALAGLRDEQSENRSKAERAAQTRDTNKERVTEFTDLKERAFLEVSGLGEKIRAQGENLTHLEQEAAQSSQVRDRFTEEVSAQEKNAEELEKRAKALQTQREQAALAILEIEQSILSQRSLQETLQQQQRNNDLRVEGVRAQQTSLEESKGKLSAGIELASAKVAEAKTTRDAARQDLEKARAEEALCQSMRKAAQKEFQEFENRRQGIVARQQALKQLEDSHASAAPAAQSVLKAVAEGKLSVPVKNILSNHVRVKSGYEKAMAALLHEVMDALLLEQKAEAGKLVEFVRGSEKGSCAIAVADMPRVTPATATDSRAAVHFVETDEVVTALVSSALANSFVTANLDEALELKNHNPDAVVVTQDGQVVTRSGVILVQRAERGAAASILNCRAELQTLEIQIQEIESQRPQHKQEEERSASELAEAQRKISRTQEKLQELEITVVTGESDMIALQRQTSELKRQKEHFESEINRLIEQNRADQTRRQEIEQKVGQSQHERQEAQAQAGQLETQYKIQSEEISQTTQKLTEARVRLATQIQQCESWQERLEPVKTRLTELRELEQKRQADAKDYEGRIARALEEIEKAEREEAEAQSTLYELESLVSEEHKKRVEAVQSIEETEVSLKKVRKELSELQNARSQAEVKLAQQRIFLDNLRDRMRQQYQMELEQLPLFAETMAPEDWALLEAEVTEKRKQLEAMGPVNLDAITEYDELEQRHTFLETQQTDMVNAKEQLLATIKQINQTTRKLFIETFEQVKINFQHMFTELFGGGKATLTLQDENDPLECGIEIVAKPPGKQLQSVSLLSGGERTMTAVSLLFAIYMVKPSPFCVLDEMDAPLDESNINRFVKILKQFVHQSQFVVITHNKRTISMADVLYGVTMEEHGISKFVSVKLGKDAAKNGHTNGATESTPSIAESFGKPAELPA